MIRKSSGIALVFLILVLTQMGCPPRISIADITGDPGRYYNKEVTVTGQVTKSFGALGQGIYEIDDGTGRLWVFTEKFGVPSKDTRVAVTGRITPGVTFGGQNYATVLRETRRRKHPGG